MTKTAQHGLTLIEVMVAVAVLAFALSALVKMTGETVNTLSYLERKTFAQWVVSNQLNEREAQSIWPSAGVETGKEEMGGEVWYWQVTTSNTESEDLRRLQVDVMQNVEDDEAVYTLTAFTHKP